LNNNHNGLSIIQLYHDKVIQDEFWNGIHVFIPTNGNTNQSQLSLLVPFNQLPLLPQSFLASTHNKQSNQLQLILTPNTKVCFLKLLGIRGVWTSFSSLTFTTSFQNSSHPHLDLCGIRYAIYFSNVRKKFVKMFKPWPIKWRCTNYLSFFLLYFVNFHFVPLVSNLLSIPSHIIWKTNIQNICEGFLVAFLKWLAIVFPIFVLHKV
jgi:hypothetical protein